MATEGVKRLHVCLVDPDCIRDWWRYGMPLCIYRRGHPPIAVLSGKRRSRRVWTDIVPVQVKRSDDG